MEHSGVTRQKALDLLDKYIPQDNLKKHCLATEAVMRGLARKLGQDEDMWGIIGLLHDLDYNETKDDMSRHGLVTAQILEREGVHNDIIQAIKAHNADNLGITRSLPVDFAITAGETITGLIVATALVYPDKRLKSVKPKSIVKRMKEVNFAANVNRKNIQLCEEFHMTLEDFVEVCLQSMAGIDKELDLV